MPPTMSRARTLIEMRSWKLCGKMEASITAKMDPATPAKPAPSPYASSLTLTRLMPSACATSSSSRIAVHARPSREFSRRHAK